MKKEEFIQKIAGYVKKYAAAYEIKVLHRQFWSPAGENPGWRKTITIILD